METQTTFPHASPPPFSPDYLSNPEFKAMVRNELSEILADFIATQEKRASDVSLIERIVRVEEAQRSHEELTRTMLGQINLRFDSMDKRIDSVDKRFEEMSRRLDRFMFWSLGLTVSATFLIITMLR